MQFSQDDSSFEYKPVPAERVALVHDWLTGMRGGEMVLEEFCRLFPNADIFTLIHRKGKVSPLIESHRIFESPLAKVPYGREQYRRLLPFFPWAIEAFNLKGYDLIISSSSSVAKGIIPPPDALHVSYVHSPMRYVWDMRDDYLGEDQVNKFYRLMAGWISHYLRMWDITSSARVDHFIANSNHVASRIRKYYRRETSVIHPPVSIDKFSVGKSTGDYFLAVSALVPYKRIDLAVAACTKLGLRLIVVGTGPERSRLEHMAGRTIEFAGYKKDEDLADLYQNAIALIHPGEEDFGIVPVECQASGRPVIAFGRGGVLESVQVDGENRTGEFFYKKNVDELIRVLKKFDAGAYDPAVIRRNAERFHRNRFLMEMHEYITEVWQDRLQVHRRSL